jgi:peptidyl-prolyl cis-trans isomerase SurA
MKRFIPGVLAAAMLLAGSAVYSQQNSNDPVLLTVGKSQVTKSEFESVYHKNNTKDDNTKESLDKYLDLYINFKLKVQEAEELGMDTASSFKEELKGYRKQLAQPYLTDKDVNEKLLKEAYDRLQFDIRASHILVKVNENALPKDTLEAYNKIMKIRQRILKGEDFNKVAKEKNISDDPSARDNGGDLGYFTAMQMVYPFETAAYATPVGEISMPVRTRYGYHIIKVVDKRPAQGEILVAHIMVKAPEKSPAADSINAKNKIDELYAKLQKGEDFAELAKTYSDDKPSAKKGGELPWFGTNRMPFEFEQASFALKSNGEYSQPVKTKYGWHIIKRLDKKKVPTFDEMKAELKSKVSKDSRSQQGRQSLIAKLKKEYKFSEAKDKKGKFAALEQYYTLIDTSYFEGKWDAKKAAALNKPMFTIDGKSYTQADFTKFLETHQSKRVRTDAKEVVNAMYNQYVDESIVAYEETRLEAKYPEFRALMQEYRDGILLFELTDKKVWTKAVKDTTGLKEYYEKNKESYKWDERADATIYTAADEKIAKDLRKMLSKNKSEKEITDALNKTSQLNVQAESKTYQKGESSVVDANWNPGISPDKKGADGKVTIVVVHKLLKPEVKSFNEAKGLVTADYQNYLEKQWLEQLRKKYKVTVNKDVLATVK